MAEPAQQYVGYRRGKLPVGGGENFAAMHEMKIEAAHFAQGQEMIVPLFRRGGGDSNFLRPGLSGGDKLARPAQRLERLMPRAGTRLRANRRVFPGRLDDRNTEFLNPGRDVPWTGNPLHVGLSRKRREERPPDRGHFGAAMHFDAAEKNAGKRGALKCSADEIRRPAHRSRQMPDHLRFKARYCRKAGRRLRLRISSEISEIEAGGPCLRKRRGGGMRESGKVLDPVDFAELGGERFYDRGFERIGIDRLQESSRETGREPLDRHGLQSVAATDGRSRSLIAPGKAGMGNKRLAHTSL